MENPKNDLSTVCEMFEEMKEKIEMLTARLGTMSEQLARPLKHRHTIDFMSNRALIALPITRHCPSIEHHCETA